jgi:hypothetical protein
LDAQTATEVGKVITTINWEGVVLIIFVVVAALIPVYKWIFAQAKEKKEGQAPLSKVELEAALHAIRPVCMFNKKLFDDVEDRILENKDILRDVVSQLKTEESYSKRIEDNIERVRKNLTDLTEVLGKIVR